VTVRRLCKLGVGGREPIARYLFKSEYWPSTKGVKPVALLPREDGETSVYRIGGLKDRAILTLGQREVGDKRKRQVMGWAKFTANAVLKAGLKLDVNDTPARHVNIVGWPEEQQDKLEKAQDLARECVLVLAADL
jgi:hypothetical protein